MTATLRFLVRPAQTIRVLRLIGQISFYAATGFLLGLIAVWWVDPTTQGGVAFLILIFVALTSVIGSLLRRLTKVGATAARDRVPSVASPTSSGRDHAVGMSVFISYRREDASADARQIGAKLAEALGGDNVFMDVRAIGPGVRFKDAIERALGGCDLLVAVIGREWFSEKNRERLQREDDYVRMEIETALARQIPIVPVLVEGASLPEASALPASLRELDAFNAIELRHGSFDLDASRLVDGILALDGR